VTAKGNERRRRSDGDRTRASILAAAARFATLEGIEGLTIGRLAEYVGMSKSSLFSAFGSKEELQLATIEEANTIFDREVVAPSLEAGTPLERLRALCERFLSHVERQVFPGGCFFASAMAEIDTRPGIVRERVTGAVADWYGLLEQQIRSAQKEGQLDTGEDATQLAFEVHALLLLANAQFLISGGDAASLDRARRGIERRLELAGAAPGGPARRRSRSAPGPSV
jgi:AcrR family transcriptional regulator